MHQITGFYFFNKGEKKFVIYSTKYDSGRFASVHEYTGLTDEQARGRFIVEHSEEVDYLIRDKKQKDSLTIKN
jgi:hypothetical protein